MTLDKSIKKKLFSVGQDFRITGREIRSYILCERQYFYRTNKIPIRNYNEHLLEGMSTDNNSYSRKQDKTEIIDGMLSPDFFENGNIVEVKDAESTREADKIQLKYYLWYINEKFELEYDGELRLPKKNKIINITYDDSVRQDIEPIVEEIYNKKQGDYRLPEFSKKDICETCMYKDLCWSNQ